MRRKVSGITQRTQAMPTLIPTGAYARVSSGKDAMLNSLSMQISYYSKLIQEHPGWQYVGVYADEAYTGTKDNRPEFERLIEDCRSGKIKQVLVKSISRFARNTVTLLETVRELKSLGVDIYFEREQIHTMSAEGELVLTLLAAVAQEESRSVSENCKWRIRKQYHEGKPSFHNAYGYRTKNGMPCIEQSEAAVVRYIFRAHNQRIGYSTIAKTLDNLDIEPPSTNRWNELTIRYILRNERYTGDLLLQKTFVADHLTKRRQKNNGELEQVFVEYGFPAIITRDEYEMAHRISAEHTQRFTPTRIDNMSTMFSGTIICSKCAKPYKRKIAHGSAAWNCGTFMRKGKAFCHGKQIPEDVLTTIASEFEGIRRILVPAPNRLIFELVDGRRVEREWQDRSRRDSWSDTARKRASEQTKARFAQ